MNAVPVSRRILLECTTTCEQAAQRGIPRVVCSVLRQAPAVARQFGVDCSPLTYAYGVWNAVSAPPTSPPAWGLGKGFYRWAAEGVCGAVPFPLLRRWFLPPSGRGGIWKGPRSVARGCRRLTRRFLSRPVHPESGDVLLLLDAWLRAPAGYWRQVQWARSRGARIGAVVYDLIPLTHPHLVAPRHRDRFACWLDEAASRVDFFLAISQTVRDQLETYLALRRSGRGWPPHRFDKFILGAELPSDCRGAIRSGVREAFAADNAYLMVGAIEARKNQAFLLDAFTQLWDRGLDVRLCLVGSQSRQVPELIQRLETHPERDRRLFCFSDLSDAELEHAYRCSQALVYPSIVEGFGLPIVEALQHGCRVLASDTAIHREVGGDCCDYFPLDSPQVLADRIAAWSTHGVPPVHDADAYRFAGWQESCEELFRACLVSEQAQDGPRERRTIRAA